MIMANLTVYRVKIICAKGYITILRRNIEDAFHGHMQPIFWWIMVLISNSLNPLTAGVAYIRVFSFY